MTDLDRLTAALADRYRIDRLLGKGGMAYVYLADDFKHDRQVALKVLRSDISSTLGPERFLREIKTAATLNHPHIMPLLDSGEVDGFLYYAMPYIDGESLADRIDREKQLPVDEARRIVKEVADGLGYAHSQGVIHRDIKPENIMLSGGHAVIADFGIARAVTEVGGTKLTQAGIAIGTATYMSPEQASGGDGLDARSDIYSLGCVLYETLVGEPPFLGNSPQAIMARHAVDQVPPIRTVRPSVKPELENIVGKALDKVPADRFQTAEQFVRALSGEIKVGPTGTFAVQPSRAAVAMWLSGVGRGPAAMEVDQFRLAIFPFDVQSPDPSHSYHANGLMGRLGGKLDGAGEISVVDQASTREAMAGSDPGPLPPGRARALAGGLGAGRFVLPVLFSFGDGFTLTANLFNSIDASPALQQSWDGTEDELPSMVDDMARWIVAQLGAGGEGRLVLRQGVSDDWNAEKAYYQGIEHLYQGENDSAIASLEEAVRIDSAMADGWYQLAFAYGYRRPGTPNEYRAIEQAYAHLDRATGVWKDIIEATYRHFIGDGAGTDSIARDLLARVPDQAEAWFLLGVVREFYRWQGPTVQGSAVEALEKAVRLHPTNPVFLWNYTWALRNDRQLALVDSLYRAAEEDGREIFLAPIQSWFNLLATGTTEQRDSIQRVLATATVEPFFVNFTAGFLNQATDSVRLAQAIFDALAQNEDRPTGVRAAALLHGALSLVSQGKWQEARNGFAAAMALEPGVIVTTSRGITAAGGYPLFDYATMALTRYVDVSQEDLAALRDSLRGWVPPEVPPLDRSMIPAYLPAVRTWLLGLAEARLGDSTAAMAQAGQLDTGFQALGDSVGLLTDLALEIRALVAAESGRLEDALALLKETGLRVADVRPITGPEYMRSLGRLLRADILFELGRHEEALQWYRGFPLNMALTGWNDMGLLSHVYGRMGQSYDALGDTEEAIDYYTRFVIRWADADAQFQPRVDSARARLQELQ